MFQRFLFRDAPRANIRRLYGAIVAQARTPVFYDEYGVPDTVEGRFDMIVLHVYLLFRRLARDGESARAVGQDVFDIFIEDMDAGIRELGVGDFSVPRKMRAMGEGYYGRAAAYDAAIAAADDDKLTRALLRNIYCSEPSAQAGASRLARYVRRLEQMLAALDSKMIEQGAFRFPEPGEIQS